MTAFFVAAVLGLAVTAWAASPRVMAGAGATLGTPITIDVANTNAGPAIHAGFVGLTTEFWDMFKYVGDNPADPDVPYEHLLENLAPEGGLSLRIGGETSDWSWWPIPGMVTPPWARWTLTPTWMSVAQKLLEDTHAHLLIGINMEADNPAISAAEVNAIKTDIGPTVPTTFELGNEPELYDKWPFYITKSGVVVYGRAKGYSFADMDNEWSKLDASLGGMPLAGPSYSSFRAFNSVERFLHVNPGVKLLTMHTYALTPKNCQKGGALAESSLFDYGSLQRLGDAVAAWARLGASKHVPVRIDEINAVTCGGEKGFSNSMGPSLWALNVLPLYAQTGVTGVNFESRPNTAQNLIQPTDTTTGWQVAVQPEYYGMLAFAQLTPPGSHILGITTYPANDALAWAVRTPQNTEHIVVTNDTRQPEHVAVRAAGTKGPATAEILNDSAGTLTATTGISLGGQTISSTTGQLTGTPVRTQVSSEDGNYDVVVAPNSATILTVNR